MKLVLKRRNLIFKESEGAMIAFMIPEGFRDVLAVSKESFAPGSQLVPKDELHITLAYLGKASELDNYHQRKVAAAIRRAIDEMSPFWIYIGGVDRFEKVEGGKYDAVYAVVRSEGLQQLHKKLTDILMLLNPDWKWDYQEYTPHVTLAYVPSGSKADVEITETEILAYKIALVIAGDTQEFVLRNSKSSKKMQVLTLNQV